MRSSSAAPLQQRSQRAPRQGCWRRMASSQRGQGDVLGPEQGRVPLQPGGMDRVVPFFRTEAPVLHIGGIRFGRSGSPQLLQRPLLITHHREVPQRVTMPFARIVGQRHDLPSSGVPGARSVEKPGVMSTTTNLQPLRPMERPRALAMDDERWGHPPRLRALLQGEMTLLILLATPTPTRRVTAQLALADGTWPLSLRS